MIGSIIGDVVGNAGAVSNIKETRVMEATIGINQRIPIEAIELAIKAVMNGSYDNDYAAELARMEYSWRKRSIPTHSEWLYPLTFDAGNGLKEA